MDSNIIDMDAELLLKRIKVGLIMAVSATLPTKWINLNSIFIVLLIVVWSWDSLFNRERIKFNWYIFGVFVLFFLLTLLSLFYSSNLAPVFSKLETRLVILVFPIIFLGSALGQDVIKLTLKAFLISCVLISVLCVVHTFYQNYHDGNTFQFNNNWLFSSENLVARFGFHPNYFSIYCGFSVFIILFLVKERELKLWAGLILIGYLSVFQLLLISRVGILSFIGLFVLSVIYEAYVARRLLQGILLVVIFSVGIFVLGMNTQMVKDKFNALLTRNIHQYNEPFRVNRRFIQWESAVAVFMTSPVFGVGTGDMQDELQKVYLEKGFTEGYENEYNPHNLFLDSAASLGILGLMSNLVLLGFSFYAAISMRSLLYMQFLILFFSISMVESTFSVQKGVAFFFFFNTIFYSLSPRSPRKALI